MQRAGFEWDAAKATVNWRRHGVTFDQAARATSDPFAIEMIDTRKDYGEERINLLGLCDGVILHVIDTERGDRIRIISARRAERHEQDNTFRANAH